MWQRPSTAVPSMTRTSIVSIPAAPTGFLPMHPCVFSRKPWTCTFWLPSSPAPAAKLFRTTFSVWFFQERRFYNAFLSFLMGAVSVWLPGHLRDAPLGFRGYHRFLRFATEAGFVLQRLGRGWRIRQRRRVVQ